MATTTPPPATAWRASAPTPTQELPRVVDPPPPAPRRPAPRRSQSSGLGTGIAIGVRLTLIVLVGAGIAALVWREVASEQDPGAEACQAMIDAYRAGVQAEPWVYVQLQTSDDPRLQQAGAALQQWTSLPEDQRAVSLGDLLTAVGSAAAGCAAVGVPLPPEMLQVQ